MKATQFDTKTAQDLVTFSSDGLCAVDRSLTYVAWNSALAKISGVPASEAIGKKVFELFPFLEKLGERKIHERVFTGETVVVDPRPYDVPAKNRTGYFQSHYWPWKNSSGEVIGIFMAIRDVGPSYNRLLYLSELSSALSKATAAEQTLDITLDFLIRSTGAERGLVVVLTEDKQFIEVVALNGTGTSIEDHERLGVEFDIPLTVAIRENRPIFSPDEHDAQKYSYRHKDYVIATGDVAAAAVPLIVEGEIIGGIAVSYKLAQIFNDEDANYWIAASNLCAQSYARAKQFDSERSARSAAENANKAKSRFLANVSHELRTPMTVVIGHAELMKNAIEGSADLMPPDLAAKLKKYAERCFQQGVMLSRILDDILDLTKIETDSITIRKEPIAVIEWLTDIAAIATQLTAHKPVEVSLAVDSKAPKVIDSDIVRAKQIVLNLISNATKFTDAGEINISASGETNPDGGQVLVIRIKDTGIGIEQARHDVIFDAFEKSRISKSERGGHGLGLAISTQLAVALGGSLRLLASQENTGSTFELKLPDLGADSGIVVKSKIDHIATQSLKGRLILLAEDDQQILEFLSDLLKSAGASIIQAKNGAEAIEFALEKKPDVAVLDLQMPVVNGFEAAKQITESVPGVPLLALSAYGLREYKDLAAQSGFKQFLLKPVDLSTLADNILALLKK